MATHVTTFLPPRHTFYAADVAFFMKDAAAAAALSEWAAMGVASRA